jgi:tRNA(Glu) U13 pseudouridine synthase TruD
MAKAVRKTKKKTCPNYGSGLNRFGSSRAWKHLGGPCKKRAKGKKKR